MEQNTRTRYAIGLALIFTVILIGAFFISRDKAQAPGRATSFGGGQTTLGSTASSSSPTPTNITGVVNEAPNIPLPDLSRPYTPPAGVPQSVRDADTKIVATAIQQVKIDPNHEPYWLQLGGYRKNAGDYVGAEQVYLYLVARWPNDPIAYNNLADLYGNYMHDYTKAVSYWNKLIALSPTNSSAYLNLSTLYRANLHDTANAKATLERGLVANPKNSDLTTALAAL